jgi:SAM-dependent MidA family methyltransferase
MQEVLSQQEAKNSNLLTDFYRLARSWSSDIRSSFCWLIHSKNSDRIQTKDIKTIAQEIIENYTKYIKAKGGKVGFIEFMKDSLYGSGGYYAEKSRINGQSSDFFTAMEDPEFLQSIGEYISSRSFSEVLEIAGGSGEFAKYIRDNFPSLGLTSIEISPTLIQRQVPALLSYEKDGDKVKKYVENDEIEEEIPEGAANVISQSSHRAFNISIWDSKLNLAQLFDKPTMVFANELPDAFPFHWLRVGRSGELEICTLGIKGASWEKLDESEPDYDSIVKFCDFVKTNHPLKVGDTFCFSPHIEILLKKLKELPAGSKILLPDYYSDYRDFINNNPRFFPYFNKLKQSEVVEILPFLYQNFDITFSPYLPYIVHLANELGFKTSNQNQKNFINQSLARDTNSLLQKSLNKVNILTKEDFLNVFPATINIASVNPDFSKWIADFKIENQHLPNLELQAKIKIFFQGLLLFFDYKAKPAEANVARKKGWVPIEFIPTPNYNRNFLGFGVLELEVLPKTPKSQQLQQS